MSSRQHAEWLRTESVEPPLGSHIRGTYREPDLADAYRIRVPDTVSSDPERLARHLFDTSPRWVAVLMRIRDSIVAVVGLKTAWRLRRSSRNDAVERVGIFRIYERHADEIVLGEDDRHLDFRLSVMRESQAAAHGTYVTVATCVDCHNLLGRTYLSLIAPFHRAVVRSTLRRAARVGWPE